MVQQLGNRTIVPEVEDLVEQSREIHVQVKVKLLYLVLFSLYPSLDDCRNSCLLIG